MRSIMLANPKYLSLHTFNVPSVEMTADPRNRFLETLSRDWSRLPKETHFCHRVLFDRVHHFQFWDKPQMRWSMARFAAYHEAPGWRGRVFTREELFAWGSQQPMKPLTLRGCAYNLPATAIEPFQSRTFDLHPLEEAIVSQLPRRGRSYVIATAGDPMADVVESNFLFHELAHAFWDLLPDYQREMRDRLRRLKPERQRQDLLRAGYDPAVLDDESHAYLAMNPLEIYPSEGSFRRETLDLVLGIRLRFAATLRRHCREEMFSSLCRQIPYVP